MEKIDKRKLPRPYIKKKPEPEWQMQPHQIKKMKEICPKGILEKPKKENPFEMTF